ncbi:MAG TPA: prolyl oligopeptidase family serine peptidase [Candidatus Hydrogenedentes bacterium]|nr:prolyl oligopeptidase family serine peptidase [Candidatus Hydrogenedentota bacterium]
MGTQRTNDHTSAVVTGFINKTMEVDGRQRHFAVYVPRQYDPRKQWPLIVFLHGMGERGDDGLLQTDVGIGRAIRRWPDRFPCLVLMPQCPDTVYWDEAVADIDAALHKTIDEYAVNPSRICLTGLSLGGFATWIYGARNTDTFAALMPVCGGGNPEDATALARVPIWAFHGADDDLVAVEQSRAMVEAVKNAGGDVRYTEYKDTGHNAWDKAYSDPKTIKWLLRQKKPR